MCKTSFESGMRLALKEPSGLVAVRECDKCGGTGNFFGGVDPNSPVHEIPCHACNGTGRIVRELTVAEALEWMIEFILSLNNGGPTTYNLTVENRNGERIMRKEDL